MKPIIITAIALTLAGCATYHSDDSSPPSCHDQATEQSQVIRINESYPGAAKREAKARCPGGYTVVGYDNPMTSSMMPDPRHTQSNLSGSGTSMYIRCK